MSKKFEVIEEGILSVGEMGKLMGGFDPCTPAASYTCKPINYNCSKVTCPCYSLVYQTACVNIYSQCGIVGGCGGGNPYEVTTPCPQKAVSLLPL